MTKEDVMALNAFARSVFEKDGFHTPLAIGFKGHRKMMIDRKSVV